LTSDHAAILGQFAERLDTCGSSVGLQELIAIQQNGPKALGFFGTRNMGFLHQNLIEILSYAMVLTVRSILSLVVPSHRRPFFLLNISCSARLG
jgi:hypothetical protein